MNARGAKDLSAKGSTPKVEIEADKFYFGPTYVKVAPGATVTVELKNEGRTEHTFTIDGLGIDEDLKPDQKAEVQVTVPGPIAFCCRFHRATGMQGAFST